MRTSADTVTTAATRSSESASTAQSSTAQSSTFESVLAEASAATAAPLATADSAGALTGSAPLTDPVATLTPPAATLSFAPAVSDATSAMAVSTAPSIPSTDAAAPRHIVDAEPFALDATDLADAGADQVSPALISATFPNPTPVEPAAVPASGGSALTPPVARPEISSATTSPPIAITTAATTTAATAALVMPSPGPSRLLADVGTLERRPVPEVGTTTTAPLTAPLTAPATVAASAPNAVTPTAPTAPAAKPPTFAAQLSAPLITLVTGDGGDQVIVVRVAPDELGPITIHARLAGDTLKLELFAPTDISRDAVRSVLGELRRDLAAQTGQASLDLSSQDRPAASGSGTDTGGRPASRGESPQPSPRSGAPAPDPSSAISRADHRPDSASTIDIFA